MSIYLAADGALKEAIKNKDYSGVLCTIDMYEELVKEFPHAHTEFSAVKELDSNIARLTMNFHNDLSLIPIFVREAANRVPKLKPAEPVDLAELEKQAILALRLKTLCDDYIANIKEV